MIKFFLVHLLLIIRLLPSLSQDPEIFPVLDNSNFPEARFLLTRSFNGTSLFGYIDGGAELYLEYGFEAVNVKDLEYKGTRYKVEIYRMRGPVEAFGIYSVSKYRCLDQPAFAEYSCQTKYQLQICKGTFYINVINNNGTLSDIENSKSIGSLLVEQIKGKSADFSGWFPDISPEKIRSEGILMKGRLGLANRAPELEDFFKSHYEFDALFLNNSGKNCMSVKFLSAEAFSRFLSEKKIGELINVTGNIIFSDTISFRRISENQLYIEF